MPRSPIRLIIPPKRDTEEQRVWHWAAIMMSVREGESGAEMSKPLARNRVTCWTTEEQHRRHSTDMNCTVNNYHSNTKVWVCGRRQSIFICIAVFMQHGKHKELYRIQAIKGIETINKNSFKKAPAARTHQNVQMDSNKGKQGMITFNHMDDMHVF